VSGKTVRRRRRPGLAARVAVPAGFAVILLLQGGGAAAHDTWFAAGTGARAGEVRLALGTGNRFPAQETSVGEADLPVAACRHGDGPARPLRAERDSPQALWLTGAPVGATKLRAAHGAITCWAQLPPYEIEIEPAKVQVYFDEIRAGAALRGAWDEMRERGVRWHERYTKYARIELADPLSGDGAAPPPRPVPLGMDIVLDGTGAPKAGDTIVFRVLRDGAPLPRFPVELVSAEVAFGFWLRTDEEGRASVRLPLAGRWLLRGTDLRPAPGRPDAWDSRFVTLAFEATPS